MADAEPIPFAKHPAMAKNGLLDYRAKVDFDLYKLLTKPLTEILDGTEDSLFPWMEDLRDRCKEAGWNEEATGILSIPDNWDNPIEFKSMLDDFGTIGLAEILANDNNYLHLENRAVQDNSMLIVCITKSLSPETKKKLTSCRREYLTAGGEESAAAMLKVLIRECSLDTKATSTAIRAQMANLPAYMEQVNYDISKFNLRVKLLEQALSFRGEVSQDLLTHVFKAYLSVKDKEMRRYAKQKRDEWEEGDERINTSYLMTKCSNKYKSLVEQKEYEIIDKDEEKFVALQAELKAALKKKRHSKESNRSNSNNRNNSNNDKKRKSEHKRSKQLKKKPHWMVNMEEPQANELHKPRQ